MRFLVKAPIVGIKVFDGDTLKKRLQLTFESEGNFNMFSNKVRQWLGVDFEGCSGGTLVSSQLGDFHLSGNALNYLLVGTLSQNIGLEKNNVNSRSQPELTNFRNTVDNLSHPAEIMSQPESNTTHSAIMSQPVARSLSMLSPHLTQELSQLSSQPIEATTQLKSISQLMGPAVSQSWDQDSESHNPSNSVLAARLITEFSEALNQTALNQAESQSCRDLLSYPSYANPLSLLIGATEMQNEIDTQCGQQDSMFQSTQIGFNNSQTSIISPELPKAANPRSSAAAITREEIEDALANSSISKHRSKKRERDSCKASKFESRIAGAIKEVIRIDDSIHDLSDQQLSLKICRVMKSRSFLRLVKRVDTLIKSLPEQHE